MKQALFKESNAVLPAIEVSNLYGGSCLGLWQQLGRWRENFIHSNCGSNWVDGGEILFIVTLLNILCRKETGLEIWDVSKS